MSKPIIKKITPFDAAHGTTISFTWSGNRTYANRLIIYNNDSLAIVFDDYVTDFSLSHTIPAHILQNGRQWIAQVQVFDQENSASALSDKLPFYTFETPEFYFDNLPADNKIANASYTASLCYYSSDWEDISAYRFYLYDSTRKILLESSILNDNEDIHYVYRGLENNSSYYIRCVGTTVNGMPLDTGYIEVHISYENPNTYARIYTTSLPAQGCVQVSSNLIIVQYNGTESFTYEDGMINLIDKTLYFNEGFLIKDDFTMLIRGIHLWQNAEIMKMSNAQSDITLSSHIYGSGQLRFRLTVRDGISTYLIYSEEQVFDSEDMITIAIRRKNNIYQLTIFTELNYKTEGNMWYGTIRPAPSITADYDSWVDTSGSTYMAESSIFKTLFSEDEPEAIALDDLWIGGD